MLEMMAWTLPVRSITLICYNCCSFLWLLQLREVLNCVRSTAWKEKKWFPSAGVSANTIFIPSPAAEKGRELPTFFCFSIVFCPFSSLRKTEKVTEPSSFFNRRPWDGKCDSKDIPWKTSRDGETSLIVQERFTTHSVSWKIPGRALWQPASQVIHPHYPGIIVSYNFQPEKYLQDCSEAVQVQLFYSQLEQNQSLFKSFEERNSLLQL